MLAQPLDYEPDKCSPHPETTRHDYVDDDCGQCKLRKELRAKRGDLHGYLKRQNDNVELDTATRANRGPSPILLEESEEDFVLYKDEEDEHVNHAAASERNSGKSSESEEHTKNSDHQALRVIASGEVVYSHEDEGGERRKRDTTPGLDEEKELHFTGPPRRKRRPKWKII
ncbi:hypothetical protein MBLNU457_g2576t3 [Dothideomycetes sp. NU457]